MTEVMSCSGPLRPLELFYPDGAPFVVRTCEQETIYQADGQQIKRVLGIRQGRYDFNMRHYVQHYLDARRAVSKTSPHFGTWGDGLASLGMFRTDHLRDAGTFTIAGNVLTSRTHDRHVASTLTFDPVSHALLEETRFFPNGQMSSHYQATSGIEGTGLHTRYYVSEPGATPAKYEETSLLYGIPHGLTASYHEDAATTDFYSLNYYHYGQRRAGIAYNWSMMPHDDRRLREFTMNNVCIQIDEDAHQAHCYVFADQRPVLNDPVTRFVCDLRTHKLRDHVVGVVVPDDACDEWDDAVSFSSDWPIRLHFAPDATDPSTDRSAAAQLVETSLILMRTMLGNHHFSNASPLYTPQKSALASQPSKP